MEIIEQTPLIETAPTIENLTPLIEPSLTIEHVPIIETALTIENLTPLIEPSPITENIPIVENVPIPKKQSKRKPKAAPIQEKSQSIPENFSTVPISIKTIMVYSNIYFDYINIFKNVPITIPENIFLTKKKKMPDIKKLVAPYGTIFSARHGNDYRGLIFKEPKKKKGFFLNQSSFYLSLGDKNVHIMIFKNTIKIAGSKKIEQAPEIMSILWGYISKIENSYKFIELENDRYFSYFGVDPQTKRRPTFTFEVVMTNVDFRLGFSIDRKKLNNLMNDQKYSDIVHLSKFETTGSVHVNIKMKINDPPLIKFKYLIMDGLEPIVSECDKNFYEPLKKTKKKNYTTFLVFLSSKVIESGRYDEVSERHFNQFINIIKENRNLIEEKICQDGATYKNE
jgi:hypothetical protein